MRDAFIRRLTVLAAADPRIVLLTGDLGFKVLDDFAARFPGRFINVGVAEQNMTGLATGMALEGKIAFTYSIANFPTLRCLEQIRNDACYHDANVKVVAIGGGFSYGALGISHHATEDLAIMRALPAITVMAPGDDWETEEATAALVTTPGTCYLRLDRASAGAPRRAGEQFVVGRARVVQDGEALTLVSTGGILEVVVRAAQRLADAGHRVRVLQMHTLKPMDAEAVLAACRETGGILTVEEHSIIGGVGSAVAEVCMDAGVRPRAFARLGLRDGFSSIVGSQTYLRGRYGLDEGSVVRRATELIHGAHV